MFGYVDGDSTILWDVRDIWKAVENIPTTKLPLMLFTESMKEVVNGYNRSDASRVNKADIKYPIIINSSEPMLVIDGFHRLHKHVKLGNRHIPCKRLDKMPLPYFVKGEPFAIPGLNFEWKSKFDIDSRFANWK